MNKKEKTKILFNFLFQMASVKEGGFSVAWKIYLSKFHQVLKINHK